MYQEFLDVGLEAVKMAEAVALSYFRCDENDLGVMIKSSDKRFLEQYQKSPVTLADKEAERAIKEYVGSFYPDHGFIGEEEGEEQVNSDFKWIIDPIDGTRNFARGLPGRAVMLALEYKSELIVSIVRAPICDELIYAVKGGGVTFNNKAVRVSDRTMQEGYLLHSREMYFRNGGLYEDFLAMTKQVQYVKNGISWEYARVATGQVDAVVAPSGMYYDNAPISLLVEEAGGKVTTLSGGIFGYEDSTMIASNGLFHSDLLGFFI